MGSARLGGLKRAGPSFRNPVTYVHEAVAWIESSNKDETTIAIDFMRDVKVSWLNFLKNKSGCRLGQRQRRWPHVQCGPRLTSGGMVPPCRSLGDMKCIFQQQCPRHDKGCYDMEPGLRA